MPNINEKCGILISKSEKYSEIMFKGEIYISYCINTSITASKINNPILNYRRDKIASPD